MTNLYVEATCGEWVGIFEGMSQDPIWVIDMTNLYVEATCGEWVGIFEGMSQDPIRVFCIVREFISTIDGVLQQ
jgi:hypothetical protein